MLTQPDEFKLWLAVLAAAIVKWLMTEKVPPDDETKHARRTRWMRSMGGIGAGLLFGIYGHGFVIRNVSSLTEDDTIFVAVLLCLGAEHLIRSAFDLLPAIISKYIGAPRRKDG